MPNQKSLVVGYLPGYSTNAKRKYDIAKVPGESLTQLVYCFAGFAWNGSAWSPATPEPKDETKNFVKLAALKEKFPALSLMISLGGWNNSHTSHAGQTAFSMIASNAASRKVFVSAFIKKFIDRDPVLFDGIDIDWEFPNSTPDSANFQPLIKEFRTQLNALGAQKGRHYPLSLAVSPFNTEYGGELADVQVSVDWFNLMAYNFHSAKANPGKDVTNLNAALYASPQDPSGGPSIDPAVAQLIAQGVPARKLVLGIPAYSHSYAGVPNLHHGLYQSYTGPGPGTLSQNNGVLTYQDIVSHYLSPFGPPHFDSASKSSYLYSPASKVFISPNLIADVQAKCKYVEAQKMAGVMFWELGADTLDDLSLVKTAAQSLKLVTIASKAASH